MWLPHRATRGKVCACDRCSRRRRRAYRKGLATRKRNEREREREECAFFRIECVAAIIEARIK